MNILFITPETSRSGAPLLLLNFIKWAIEKNLLEPVILLSNPGSLDEEFQRLGKTFFYYQNIFPSGRGILYRVYCRLFNSNIGKKWYLRRLRSKLAANKPDLIYSNTIVNGNLLEFVKFLDVPTITHVHELTYLAGLYGEDNLAKILRYTSYYIACSKHAMLSLINNYGIPEKNIAIIYSSVQPNASALLDLSSNDLSLERAIKSGKKIVGGSGSFGWIKGSDLLIPLMKQLLSHDENIFFLWVGGSMDSNEFKQLIIDIRNADLDDSIFFTGPVDNPGYYFSLMSVFVLLSREESLSLVCLENMLLMNPVVCFEKSGGAVELLEDWPDNILPYLDISSVTRRVIEILNDKLLAERIGISLRNNVIENFNSEMWFSKTMEIMLQPSVNHLGEYSFQ